MRQSLADLLHFLLLQFGLEIRHYTHEYWKGAPVQCPASTSQPKISVDTCQTVNLIGLLDGPAAHALGLWQFPRKDLFTALLLFLTTRLLLEHVNFFPKQIIFLVEACKSFTETHEFHIWFPAVGWTAQYKLLRLYPLTQLHIMETATTK